MNTSSTKIVVALVALFTLFFAGCQEVEDLATGATASDIQIVTVTKDIADADLNSNSVVTFSVDVKNLGGLDSAGVVISAYNGETLIGQVKTGALGSAATPAIPAEKNVTISWKAIAGSHSAVFYIAGDSASVANKENTRIALEVAVADLKVVGDDVVALEKSSEEITNIITGTQTVAEITADVETLLLDESKTEDEVAVLQTIKIAKDENLKISATEAPTAITFEDTTVSALFIPLADENGVTVENSFIVSISTEVEEVVSSAVTAEGTKDSVETKTVALPILVKKVGETTTLKNGLGSIVVDGNGNIAVPAARAYAGLFWALIAAELNATGAGTDFDTEAQVNYMDALIKFMGKVTSIISAYELQSAVTNKKPVITIFSSLVASEERVGNDLVRTTQDEYTATVSDDKAGATIVFDSATSTYTATDSDGESVSVTVTISYTTQTIVDYYEHDQGIVN